MKALDISSLLCVKGRIFWLGNDHAPWIMDFLLWFYSWIILAVFVRLMSSSFSKGAAPEGTTSLCAERNV